MNTTNDNIENAADEKTGGVLKTSNFKSAGDWINQLMDEHCTTIEGAVEAVEEVKDEDGKVTAPGVRGKVGKRAVNVEAVQAFAGANNITYKSYPNPGMTRMNIGNMLRSAAKKRCGLFVPTEAGDFGETDWAGAPSEFVEAHGLEGPTHNRDGSKIKVETAKPEAEADTSE